MSMAYSCNVLARGAILHSKNSFIDNFTSTRAHHVNSKKSISFFITQNFYQSIRIGVSSSSAVSWHWEFTHFIINSLKQFRAVTTLYTVVLISRRKLSSDSVHNYMYRILEITIITWTLEQLRINLSCVCKLFTNYHVASRLRQFC